VSGIQLKVCLKIVANEMLNQIKKKFNYKSAIEKFVIIKLISC
jgi:hypothetical protein